MPRDDLTIDFVSSRGEMAHLEQKKDAAEVLEEFAHQSANLPNEIAYFQEEIKAKDELVAQCMSTISKHDSAIQKWIRANGSHTPNPKEESHRRVILANYDRAELLTNDKMALAKKSKDLMYKHLRWLDEHIQKMVERGEMQDDDLPSTIRPQPARQSGSRIDHSATTISSGPSVNAVQMVPARHPNQYPTRMIPAHVQSQQNNSAASSVASTTPATAMMLQRNRESSLGAAAANKRQRLTGGLGALAPTSGHVANRASSNAPGTPGRGATPVPVSARAGSAGPRASQKSSKKVAPHGSRQSGQLRKPIKKTGLVRVKRPGNKNSPSSIDELSEGATGSDEEDEAGTPQRRKDADGDDEMVDGDDEDGGDNNKYCICQSVSYGDMVACDNEACPLEWFHWTCVGLKSEPAGSWICPVCTENGFGK
ncbi:hypothetical protein QTJ16_002771 [Diplocarpon rosae]|uniref:Chromatin modification-related protein n=1 Tax=Diplocarpon rosae TaxID=946125 RepID=A0AAD9WE91_9HELO|nr:hypothetical protein QTJ16_002771 [Diplocarpon rosae]PBP26489.1 PHD-finger domain-containing protein [Diplocarpon rosae]